MPILKFDSNSLLARIVDRHRRSARSTLSSRHRIGQQDPLYKMADSDSAYMHVYDDGGRLQR